MADERVVIFDGVCNFCNGTVDFIIARDRGRRFRFAPMQTDAARALIDRYYAPGVEPDTFLLIRDGTCLVRSDAAVAIARELTWPWPLLGALAIVPRPIRDACYGLFARHRYRLFGRRDACRTPGPEIRDRFLS